MAGTTKSKVTRILVILVILAGAFLAVRFMLASKPTQPPQPSRVESAETTNEPDLNKTDTEEPKGPETPPAEELPSELDALVHSAGTDLVRSGLNPARMAKAKEIYIREREMWARFKGLSGNVEISVTIPETNDDIRLNAEISMGEPRIVLSDNPRGEPKWECPMTVKDRDGKWSFIAESRAKYKVVCDDPALARKLEGVLAGVIPDMLFVPRTILLMLDTGDGVGGPASVKEDEYFKFFAAYLHPDFPDADDCFLSRPSQSFENNLVFENGRVVGFGSGVYGEEPSKFSYGNYVELPGTGISFPSEMSFQSGKGRVQVTLRLSDLRPNEAK